MSTHILNYYCIYEHVNVIISSVAFVMKESFSRFLKKYKIYIT